MATTNSELREVLLRRKNLILPWGFTSEGNTKLSQAEIATFNLNLQSLGYTLHSDVIDILKVSTNREYILNVFKEIILNLKTLRGVKKYSPMYPNFPQQVMEASEAELYINAISHYFSSWIVNLTQDHSAIWLPKYDKKYRKHLDEKVELTVLKLAFTVDVYDLANSLVWSNTSLSESDKKDLKVLVPYMSLNRQDLIPNKENLAYFSSLIFEYFPNFIRKQIRTATDVLRFAVALSNGDVSLASPSIFRKFNRKERRFILELLEDVSDETREEDMLRWKNRWIRLGERLHPGDYFRIFKKSFNAFNKLRNKLPIETFNSKDRTASS